MPEIIKTEIRTCAKEKECDYCKKKIEIGETYIRDFIRDDDGSCHGWFGHALCDWIANDIWGYITDNNSKRMTHETFIKGINRFCKEFTDINISTNTKYKIKKVGDTLNTTTLEKLQEERK